MGDYLKCFAMGFELIAYGWLGLDNAELISIIR